MDDKVLKIDPVEMALLLIVGGLVLLGLGFAMIAVLFISCSFSPEPCPEFSEFMGRYLRGE